ncbi:MAG: hypothetical protein ACRC6X_06660, partial [Culicoidibacterales bacterium]
LEVVDPDFEYYTSSSKKIMRFLAQFSTSIASGSIDEAYLDVSHYFENTEITNQTVVKLAQYIQGRLLKELGFPSNIGISTNRFLAKMASELRKPFAIETLFVSEIEAKLWPLAVGDMYGIGKKSAALLIYINVKTIGDLALFENDRLLENLLGKHILEQQMRARGIFSENQSIVKQREAVISISQSRTFKEDVAELVVIERKLAELWANIVEDVSYKKHKVRCIKVFYKTSDFQTMQRSHTFKDYSNNFALLLEKGMELFLSLWDGEAIRLVGIGVSDFIEQKRHAEQLNLFEMDKKAFAKTIQTERKKSVLELLEKSHGLMTGKDLLEKRRKENGSKN